MLQLEIMELKSKIYLLQLKGNLDSTSASSLYNYTFELLQKDIKKIIFDLSQIEFISSSGIGFFLKISQNSKIYSPNLAITQANKEVLSVLHFFHVKQKIPIFDTNLKAQQYLTSTKTSKKKSTNTQSNINLANENEEIETSNLFES